MFWFILFLLALFLWVFATTKLAGPDLSQYDSEVGENFAAHENDQEYTQTFLQSVKEVEKRASATKSLKKGLAIAREFADNLSAGLESDSEFITTVANGVPCEWAEGFLLSVRDAMDAMFDQTTMIEDSIERFGVDGVVYHPIKSCRTVSTGLADSRRHLMDRTGIPSLFIESDMMDRRVVSEAQLKNRIDAFFEGLNSRKQQKAAAAAAGVQ